MPTSWLACMQEQRPRSRPFLKSICGMNEVSLYEVVKAVSISQVDSSAVVSSLPALVCHLDHDSFTVGTNLLLPGLTSTSEGASSSSNGIPVVTSIAPEATQGSDADAGISGGSVSERQSSRRSAQPAASSSGAMPADITGAHNKGFPYFQRSALLLSFLPCLLQSTSI